jgi:hypothetical protein
MSCRWFSSSISREVVAISFGMALLQQESLYDYLPNSSVASMALCVSLKNVGASLGWEHSA